MSNVASIMYENYYKINRENNKEIQIENDLLISFENVNHKDLGKDENIQKLKGLISVYKHIPWLSENQRTSNCARLCATFTDLLYDTKNERGPIFNYNKETGEIRINFGKRQNFERPYVSQVIKRNRLIRKLDIKKPDNRGFFVKKIEEEIGHLYHDELISHAGQEAMTVVLNKMFGNEKKSTNVCACAEEFLHDHVHNRGPHIRYDTQERTLKITFPENWTTSQLMDSRTSEAVDLGPADNKRKQCDEQESGDGKRVRSSLSGSDSIPTTMDKTTNFDKIKEMIDQFKAEKGNVQSGSPSAEELVTFTKISQDQPRSDDKER